VWFYRETRGTVCISRGTCKKLLVKTQNSEDITFSGWIYMLIRGKVMYDVFSKNYTMVLQCKNVFITTKSLYFLTV